MRPSPGATIGVLHLHRLEHEQRRAAADAVAGGDQLAHDPAGHRRGQHVASLVLGGGDRQRVHALHQVAAVRREQVHLLAERHNAARPRAPSSSTSSPPSSASSAAPISSRPLIRSRQPALLGLCVDLDHLAARAQAQRLVPDVVEPPAVDPMPGRMWIGAGGCRRHGSPPLPTEQPQGGDRKGLVVRRRRRCEQLGRVVGNERRRHGAGGEGVVVHHPREEFEVGRETHDLGRTSASRSRRSAAARSGPQTTILASIGS